MMMVMTMMAVDLHLRNNPKQDAPVCQFPFVHLPLQNFEYGRRIFCQNCGMRSRFMMAASVAGLALALAPAYGGTAVQKSAGLVDLNRATIPELLRLPGMTE